MARVRTAVITGAAGFIGSHLSERLVGEGWRVRGVDCLTPYYDPALKERHLTNLNNEPRFSLDRVDLRTAEIEPMLEGVDVVWHLAAQAGVRSSWGSDFESYSTINVNATQRILEAALSRPPERLVYASSSSVYGEARVFPSTEDSLTRPISPYGVTKLAGEHMARLYHRNYGLPTVSMRYFTVYGPRQRPDMGFHKFFRAVSDGNPVTIYGDGEQTRDFTYISDVTEANLGAGLRGVPGEVYNVSGGSQASVLEVLGLIEEASGGKMHREFLPRQKGDPRHTGGDSSRAKRDFDYHPKIDIKTGIDEMAVWMKRYLEGLPE